MLCYSSLMRFCEASRSRRRGGADAAPRWRAFSQTCGMPIRHAGYLSTPVACLSRSRRRCAATAPTGAAQVEVAACPLSLSRMDSGQTMHQARFPAALVRRRRRKSGATSARKTRPTSGVASGRPKVTQDRREAARSAAWSGPIPLVAVCLSAQSQAGVRGGRRSVSRSGAQVGNGRAVERGKRRYVRIRRSQATPDAPSMRRGFRGPERSVDPGFSWPDLGSAWVCRVSTRLVTGAIPC